jgi:hypothetical protein
MDAEKIIQLRWYQQYHKIISYNCTPVLDLGQKLNRERYCRESQSELGTG